MPVMMFKSEKARRAPSGKVSGWRAKNQASDTTASASSSTNVARQPAVMITPWPIAGAIAGTMMNTAITIDMMRAMARPS